MPETGEQRAELTERRGELGLYEPEERRQFVERSIRFDAGRVLRYARGADESGGAIVARAGVEPRSALASGRPGSRSSGELNPWTGQ